MTSFSFGERVKIQKMPTENMVAFSKYGVDKTGKGEEDGACNQTECSKSFANFYNKVTKKWYCRKCALRIEGIARKDNKSFYEDLEGVVINGYA